MSDASEDDENIRSDSRRSDNSDAEFELEDASVSATFFREWL